MVGFGFEKINLGCVGLGILNPNSAQPDRCSALMGTSIFYIRMLTGRVRIS